MDPNETDELSEALSRSLAAKVREELARRRMSRQRLADDAKISISTLEKALNGSRRFTLSTIIRLEEALHLKLRPSAGVPEVATGSAPVELGGYSFGAVKWLQGDYLTLRPSFDVKEAIYAYRTNISWNAETTACVSRNRSGSIRLSRRRAWSPCRTNQGRSICIQATTGNSALPSWAAR